MCAFCRWPWRSGGIHHQVVPLFHSPGSEAGERTASHDRRIRTHPRGEAHRHPLMLTAVCIPYHDGRELPASGRAVPEIVTNLLSAAFGRERAGARLSQEPHLPVTEGSRGIDRQPAIEILCRSTRAKTTKALNLPPAIAAIFDEVEPNCGLLTLQDGQYNFRHLTLQGSWRHRHRDRETTMPAPLPRNGKKSATAS